MTKTVWKINLAEKLVHMLPMGSTPIHVDYQAGEICIWLMVDDRSAQVEHAFLVSGTGWSLPEFIRPDQHIASVRNPDNRNCWHVWNLGYLRSMNTHDQRTYEMRADETLARLELHGEGE